MVFELEAEVAANADVVGGFGVEVSNLLQVIEPTSLTPVPLAPAVVLGIMSHRGRIVTVVDPSPILMSDARPRLSAEARVVLLRHGQRTTGNVGLLVTRVREIVPAADLKQIDVPPGSGMGWVARRGRRLINIIPVEPFLAGLVAEFGSGRAFEPHQGVLA
ncbi:MAG: chemotaxis protein CheW [Deltaproteobacteria bacterium]|nr:chemotaxis protein CheW [Deltaproteobacteria bacterium]